mgnify:FL=1
MTKVSYNKKIGAIKVCWVIDARRDRPYVSVHVQENGPMSRDKIGKCLGSGCGDTVSEAASDAMRSAVAALQAGA